MDVEKLRNLTDAELLHQQQELNDQLFRLKFQLKMGQTESLTKIRGLRKDVARIKTIIREKELAAARNGASAAPAVKAVGAPEAAKAKSAKGKTPKTRAVKTTAKPAIKRSAAHQSAPQRKK